VPAATPAAGPLPHVNLLGSGAILREVIRASELLAEHWGVASTVWSVTSWKELRREAQECRRWNMLHPEATPRRSYLEDQVAGVKGVFVAASDHVRTVPEQLDPWIPGGLFTLGTDGFGRSDFRSKLREHFEVNRHYIVVAALKALSEECVLPAETVAKAIQKYQLQADKINPLHA
jgi:pyruvate dehydrogenase E1 component